MIYIVGTVFSALFAAGAKLCGNPSSIVQNRDAKTARRLLAFFSFLPLTLIMAFRYDVGTDFMNYWWTYSGSMDDSRLEPGFRLFCAFLRLFSMNPAIFIFTTSVVICAGYYYGFYTESCNAAYSILLFVLAEDFFKATNTIRQSMAQAILIIALPYIREKKWKPVLIFVVLATLFHKSALIIIIFFLLYSITIPPLIGAGIMTVAFFSSSILRTWVFPLLSQYGYFAGYFLESSFYSHSVFRRDAFLIFLCFFILISYFYPRTKNNSKLKMFYTAISMALFLISTSGAMPQNFSRLWHYMMPFIIIYTPEVTRQMPNKVLRMILNAAILLAFGLMCINNLSLGNYHALPYQTYLHF